MRVSLLTHEPYHPPSGGGSAEARYIVQELRRRGHAVKVFGPRGHEGGAPSGDPGIELHEFTGWRMGRYARWRNLKYLLYPAALARLVTSVSRRERPDILLAQHAISSVAAGRVGRGLRVPVVMNFLDHLTGFMETWPAWRMPPALRRVLQRYELNLPRRLGAEAVLTVSDELADRLAANGYPRDRLHPIYYGYDAGLFRFDPAAVAARGSTPPTVVMHGSFDHHHLGRIAGDAMVRVVHSRPEVVFAFVGPETAAWRRFQREARTAGVLGAVRHAGFVPYAEVGGLLARATAGWVPYEESSGTHCAFVAKAVEYLALGLPVASTPLAGLRRYFAREPLIRFSGFDAVSLADTLLGWLNEPPRVRETLAAAAARSVRQQLDWSVVCSRAVDALEIAHQRAARRT